MASGQNIHRKQTADPPQSNQPMHHKNKDANEYKAITEEVEPSGKQGTYSDGSADLERDSEEDDILESHLNRNDREKIKNLIDMVNEDDKNKQPKGSKNRIQETTQQPNEEHKIHQMFEELPKDTNESGDFDRESEGESEYESEEVQTVKF